MQQSERFMVRLVHHKGDVTFYENLMADSRPTAIKLAEKIGKIDPEDHGHIRSFLEGKEFPKNKLFVTSDNGEKMSTATIYKIDG